MMKVTLERPWAWIMASGLVVSMLGAGTAWSYLRTAQHSVVESLRDAVPIAFELERVGQLTRELIPEIQASQKVAAQLEVEVEYLEREIRTMSDSQAEAKSQMQKLRAALGQSGDSQSSERHSFGDRTFSRVEVEQDLSRRLERYENAAVQLQAREKLLVTRRQTLTAAVEKIRQYQRNHDALVEKTESLRGELKLAELAADAHQIDFDHSKLQAAKTLAEEVEKRIRTVQKMVAGQTVAGDIPVDADSRPVSRRFDDYFGKTASTGSPSLKPRAGK